MLGCEVRKRNGRGDEVLSGGGGCSSVVLAEKGKMERLRELRLKMIRKRWGYTLERDKHYPKQNEKRDHPSFFAILIFIFFLTLLIERVWFLKIKIKIKWIWLTMGWVYSICFPQLTQ